MPTLTRGNLEKLDRMIQQQIVDRGITAPDLLAAMRRVPRDHFIDTVSARRDAFADRAMPIAHGQSISQPYVVALMCERLELKPHHRVLEIGTGCGYHAAIVAQLCAAVYTVERIKPLLDAAFERVLSLDIHNVHFRWADGGEGWTAEAPFDRVLLTAAPEKLPVRMLLENLVDDGIAVLPVGPPDAQKLVQVRRIGSSIEVHDICVVRFVPLVPGVE